MGNPDIVERLQSVAPAVGVSEFRGQTRLTVPFESLYQMLETLKNEFGFDLLIDVTCVDYLNYRDAKDRFGMVYLLANTHSAKEDSPIFADAKMGTVPARRLTVRCFVNDPEPTVPSAVPLWQGADWLEREVWDLFGIRFTGHPDLRRIVLPEEFTAHPLRKDYPLQGRGERHNFPVITRAEG